MCVSLAGNAHFDSIALMEQLARYMDAASAPPPAVATAAVEAWSFLLTDVPASAAQQHFAECEHVCMFGCMGLFSCIY